MPRRCRAQPLPTPGSSDRPPSVRGADGRPGRRLCAAILALALSGCGGAKRDALERRLAEADALYRSRGEGGLTAMVESHLSLNDRFPDNPEVLWRLSRAYALLGDVEPETAERHYANARDFGLRCLLLNGSFAGLAAAQGGRVTKAAVAELPEESVPCVVWTAMGWARLVDTRGAAGMALDLEPIEALARRAVELDPRYGSGRAQHALGLALALPPDVLDPNLKAADAALQEAIAQAPGRLQVQVDHAAQVLLRRGERDAALRRLREVAAHTPKPADPDLAEDLAAAAHARALLVELGDAPGASPKDEPPATQTAQPAR